MRYRGGSHRISNFSQIQKSPKLPRGGGGGAKKIMDFFHNLGFFFLNASLRFLAILSTFAIFFYSNAPLMRKVEEGVNYDGKGATNVIASCPPEWRPTVNRQPLLPISATASRRCQLSSSYNVSVRLQLPRQFSLS